jgi:predicted metal-dependent hydrolase
LEFRRSARARRISLRVDQAKGRVILTAPASVARRHALDFLARQEGWLTARVAQLPTALPFTDGATVPVLGVPHLIRPTAAACAVCRHAGRHAAKRRSSFPAPPNIWRGG